MNRLAIMIGMVFSSLLLIASTAHALGPQVNPSLHTPPGMTQGEYHALMLSSVELNQKHPVGPEVSPSLDPWLQNFYARARFKNVQAIDPWQSNLYARKAYETRTVAVHSQPASTGGFPWGDAGIDAAIVLGTLLVGTIGVLTIRHNRRPIAH